MEEPGVDAESVQLLTMIGVDSGHDIGVPLSWGFGDDILNITFAHIERAMVEAMKKHGRPTRDPVRGALTLAEECGEVGAEALDATRPVLTPADRLVSLGRMYDELAQVAGFAFLLMISMHYVFEEAKRNVQPA